MVCAVKGYPLILVMPESMSVERRRLMAAYGAAFELTPREQGMKVAIQKAREIVQKTPGAWMPQQFDNPANPEIHRKTTAEEIWADTNGAVDFLIAGVGTGGTGVSLLLGGLFDAVLGDTVIAQSDDELAIGLSLSIAVGLLVDGHPAAAGMLAATLSRGPTVVS